MKNRFVMPSLIRLRADPENSVPIEPMGQYYTQRYHNALIITEPCLVSADYNPFWGQPGIFNQEQAEAWVDIVDRVHSRATNIVA